MANEKDKDDLKDAQKIVSEVEEEFNEGFLAARKANGYDNTDPDSIWLSTRDRKQWWDFVLSKTYFNLSQGKKKYPEDWDLNKKVILATATYHGTLAGKDKNSSNKTTTFLEVIGLLPHAKQFCGAAAKLTRKKGKDPVKFLGFVCDI